MMKHPAGYFIVASVFFLLGTMYDNGAKPCIENYHTNSAPYFGQMNQRFLENLEPYDETSDLGKHYKNPNEFIKAALAKSENETGHKYVYVNENNGDEFFVPISCYVGETDWLGDPTLYRKEYNGF